MITDIQNFTYKSFKNYSTPKDFFKKRKIYYLVIMEEVKAHFLKE